MVIKCRFDLSHIAKILKNRTDQFRSDKLPDLSEHPLKPRSVRMKRCQRFCFPFI